MSTGETGVLKRRSAGYDVVGLGAVTGEHRGTNYPTYMRGAF